MPNFRIAAIVTAAVFVLGAAGLARALPQADFAVPAQKPEHAALQVAQADTATRQVPQSQEQMQLSFAPVVKQVAPAVVNVYATTISRQSNSPFADDPFFSQLFGRGGPFQVRPRESESLGSGVIIDPSGIIVTNNHVVNGATDVKVALQDGHQYDVQVLLADAKTDLAVLKIKNPGGKVFPTLKIANSDNLQVGDLVLAIGNPFGVGQTVTSGIVSALQRTGVESSDYEAFIQTDAAINPGNSGGALVNLRGELVGINTAIFTRSGGSVGIGFAIPANMVQTVAHAAENGGKLVFPWLGARFQDVTQQIADSLNLSTPRGAMVTEIAPNSPAAAAGLQSGDVITAIDGIPVLEPQSLNYRIATKPIGSTATLTYLRNGHEAQAAVRLEPAPSGPNDTVTISGNNPFAGATAATLNPALAQQFGLPFSAKGVVITKVAPNSPADQTQFRPGDIVLDLNNTKIADAQTFQRLATGGGNGWQITVQRQGQLIHTYLGE